MSNVKCHAGLHVSVTWNLFGLAIFTHIFHELHVLSLIFFITRWCKPFLEVVHTTDSFPLQEWKFVMAVITSVYAHLCNVQKPPVFLRKTLLSQVVIFRNVHFKHLLYIGGVYDFFSLVFQDKTNMACFRRVLMCYNPVACYYAVFI